MNSIECDKAIESPLFKLEISAHIDLFCTLEISNFNKEMILEKTLIF